MIGKKKPFFKGGYSKLPFLINFLFNSLFSLIFIICSIPLLIIISLIIKIVYGGNILYKGTRLGIDKTPFTMYKFRTLTKDADKIIGAELLTQQIASTKQLVTPFGKFLRETRLDELPQLFNILKGDMDFLGPRPERPEIYEKYCKDIEGYDERFTVKPGLIGYSQLFTPHSAPKKIRTLIDHKLLKRKQNFIWDIGGILVTILIVVKRIFISVSNIVWHSVIKSKLLGLYKEKRNLDRFRLNKAVAYFGKQNSDSEVYTDKAKLIDINEEAILIYLNSELTYNNIILKLETDYKRKFKKKIKRALCTGSIYRKIALQNSDYRYAYVINYTPVTPLNYYMVHQYFLHESII